MTIEHPRRMANSLAVKMQTVANRIDVVTTKYVTKRWLDDKKDS